MERTQDEIDKKNEKTKKTVTVILIVAAVAIVCWVVISIAQNLTMNERIIYNGIIPSTVDAKYPYETKVLDCSEVFHDTTMEGKKYSYCIVKLHSKDDTGKVADGYYYLVVGGHGKGDIYTQSNFVDLDSVNKGSVKFEIKKSMPDVNYTKINNTLKRYISFKGIKK